MSVIRFYKEDSKWYVDLPTWEGKKEDLEMALGADDLLNKISNNGNEVKCIISKTNFANADSLSLKRLGDTEGGGYYYVSSYKGYSLDFEIWLCDVVKFVFGELPHKIFFKEC